MRSKVNTYGPVESGRLPRYDEKDLMKQFSRHVEKCSDCTDTLRSSSSRGLCSKGYAHVTEMAPYFYCSNGKPFSLLDRNTSQIRSRVLVPEEYSPVSRLFEAIDAGRDLSPSSKPVVVHNSTKREHRHEPRQSSPTLIKLPYRSESRRSNEKQRPEVSYRYYEREPRRGGLYHADLDRRRHSPEQVIIIPGDRPRRTIYRN